MPDETPIDSLSDAEDAVLADPPSDDALEAAADALMARETLSGEEVAQLVTSPQPRALAPSAA